MKRFYLLLAAATLLAAIAGCQKEPVGNENAESAKAYAQLNISFATSSTKSVDDSGDYDAGSKSEYEVKSATLYFVKEGTVASVETLNGNFSEHKDGDNVYYTHVVDKLSTGMYNVYATINKTLDGVTVGTSENELQTSIQGSNTDALFGNVVPASGMPMSSRLTSAAYGSNAGTAGLYQTVNIQSSNTKDNPCPISLEIERSMAKVVYNAQNADNVYDIYANRLGSGTKIATVALKQYSVLNQSKQWYAFRRVIAHDGTTWQDKGFGMIGEGYLYDPNIQQKNSTEATNADTYVFDGTVRDIKAVTASATEVLAYTYENAVHQSNQLAGYVTSIRFVGKITPETAHLWYLDGSTLKNNLAYVANSDLFYYDNEFYTSLEALNANTHLGVSASNFRDFNVKFYDDGTCYYDYYIKHFDNLDSPNMGKMEYAIVRNNSYEVTVTKILSTGNDETTDVAASTPVEQKETYFQVKLTIRPWVVRAQNATLG